MTGDPDHDHLLYVLLTTAASLLGAAIALRMSGFI
jgi:hypothetical protein